MSLCPPFAPFFGLAGVASAMVFSTVGAALGTAKAGIGIAGLGTFKPELIMKSLIPVVMSGIIAVYGLVVSVLIAGSLKPHDYPLFSGFIHLGAGLACGFTGMAAGYAIGYVGDSCVRAYVQESKVFVSMVLILIFAEVLGLYGLIVALIMNTKATAIAGDAPENTAYAFRHNQKQAFHYDLIPREASEFERLRRLGTRLLRSRSLDLDVSDSEPEDELELELELLSESDSEPEESEEFESEEPELEVDRDL
ncbi:hypothetical protein NLJ89_g8181 [Agrocybe chaxingu]|uniref:V-type proton ATPase proteolipid subunit n=1 Tax=Agrocybe chaxingu TaxID=84603 RepID=A0A9W8JT43_9AGAR|nr:hypothetical protein NLJ89_g8181 [Agrocybe chaxingu]